MFLKNCDGNRSGSVFSQNLLKSSKPLFPLFHFVPSKYLTT